MISKEKAKPLLIGKRYKIVSDDLNVTLCLKRINKKTGGEYWTNLAYFSTPQNALGYLVEHEIKGTGMEDFETVIAKINELYDLIKSLPV